MGKQVKYLPEEEPDELPAKKVAAMTIADDDQDELPALKKKGNTTEEPKQNSGTTTPGSPVSKEPGTKEEQPSSKSTEDKYFEAYGEKLQKQKSDKYLQTLQSDVDNFAKTLPLDRTNQKSVDQYNAKLTEYHNQRSKELADQTDKELQSEYSSEFERVKAQSEKFNSQLGKFQEARQPQEEESTLTKIVKGDAVLAPIASVLFDAIPSAIASSKVNAKPFAQHVYDNNVSIPIEKVASTAEDKQKVFKDAEDKYRKKVGDEQFEREKSLYSIEQTNQTLEAFKEMSAQDRDRQLKLKGIPQEWANAKGVSGVFLYGLSSVAEVAGQIPASIATLGTSTYFMERGDILKGGIEEAATAKGVSPETFIKSYPEELTKISEIADQYGAANAALDLISLGTGIGMVAKKAIGTKLMKDIMVRPGMRALINVAQVPGKAAGAGIMEGFTEGWQETNTIIAGKISSGEAKDYADGFNKLNDKDKDRIEEAARKGGFAGSVLAGGGSAITQQSRVDKYNTITKERAARKFEAPPAPPVKVMSVADVIKQATAPITSTEDAPKIEQAAATIIESVENGGTTLNVGSVSQPQVITSESQADYTVKQALQNRLESEGENVFDEYRKLIDSSRSNNTEKQLLYDAIERQRAAYRQGTTTTQTTGEPVQQVAEGQEQQGTTTAVQQSATETGQVGTEAGATVLESTADAIVQKLRAKQPLTTEEQAFRDANQSEVNKAAGRLYLKEKAATVPKEEPTYTSAIDKYDNDPKFTIDDLVDELESSDNPKIQEAVSKYREDVREGLEVWGGREDSESRETGFVNEIRKITGETPSIATESKSPEAPVQKEQVSDQGAAMGSITAPDLTLGTNFQKVDGAWQVKQADGTWAPVINKNPTKEQQNQELKHLKEIQAQLEAQEPQNLKMSNTEKGRIAQLEAHTPEGAARKFFWSGGKALWGTSGKRRGIKEEGGLNEGDKELIRNHVSDDGMSIDAIAEKISEENPNFSVDEAKQAVINILAHSDPKNWYAEQLQSEDPEYLSGAEARFNDKNQLSQQIAELETQEQAIAETNKQLYENERRVNQGSQGEGNGTNQSQTSGERGQEGGDVRQGGESQKEPGALIRENGNADQSKQALTELESKNLTHVSGLGMGQNQAKGSYVSTEEDNRYETEGNKAKKVRVKIKNPFVTDGDVFAQIQRAVIEKRFGKKSIDELSDTEIDLLAEMMTEHFTNEGYDSIYFPQSESQEGELVVFDRDSVEFSRDWTAYDEAIHQASQTTLSTPPIKNAQFMKSDKSVELNVKYKKLREQLRTLNKLVNCR